MSESVEASVLVSALQQIGRDRARLEDEVDAAIAEIVREEKVNRKAIEEGHRRLVALRVVRREHEDKRLQISETVARWEADAIREGLRRDRERFLARVALVDEAVRHRDAQLEAELLRPEVAVSVGEYENYLLAEPSLGSMPAAIRRSVVEKHQRLLRKLDPYIRAANVGPPPLATASLGLGLVAAADPSEGPPEALVVVLPVPYEVYSDWRDRPEDLATQLTYRVLGAVFRLLDALGASDAPVHYDEVHGNLAIQVWLGDHVVEGELRERTLELIEGAYEEAAELWAASVEIYTVWVRPELLAGEEGAP